MTLTTQDLRGRIRRAIASQKPKTITILSSLLAVQDELGYIPKEAVQGVAEFTHSTNNDVWGVASFYSNFRFTPLGSHVIEVCWGSSCHLVGAMSVIQEITQALGITGEGNTSDGSITLRFNTCLGACAQGPVISVDHKLVGRLKPERAREIAQRLLESSGRGEDV